MKTMSARDAKTHFADVMRSAQNGPLTITKNGEPTMVVMSPERFESLSGDAHERYLANLERMRIRAVKTGLTQEKLDEILNSLK